MINRRMLRIKALQIFYAYSKKQGDGLEKAEKELMHSLERTYDLYLYFIQLLIKLGDFADYRIDLAKNRKLASNREVNPSRKFANNRVIKALREDESLQKTLRNRGIDLGDADDSIKDIFDSFIKSDAYLQFMEGSYDSLTADKKILTHLLAEEINYNESLAQELEKKSVYWNDDIEFALSLVVRTVKSVKLRADNGTVLLPQYGDQEDLDFVRKLLRKSILQFNENRNLVQKFTQKWDVERLAELDLLTMIMAITEIKEFPSIPVKVTLNEYIEMAKYYGTSKSAMFINGVLDRLVNYMRDNELFEKQGRGLIGSI